MKANQLENNPQLARFLQRHSILYVCISRMCSQSHQALENSGYHLDIVGKFSSYDFNFTVFEKPVGCISTDTKMILQSHPNPTSDNPSTMSTETALCSANDGDGCGGYFILKQSAGLCAKCTKLATLAEGTSEFVQWSVSARL